MIKITKDIVIDFVIWNNIRDNIIIEDIIMSKITKNIVIDFVIWNNIGDNIMIIRRKNIVILIIVLANGNNIVDESLFDIVCNCIYIIVWKDVIFVKVKGCDGFVSKYCLCEGKEDLSSKWNIC